jgi:cephalosporin hydroxylase
MLLVLDTAIDELTPYPDRPWGPGASPKSAVIEFMNTRPGMFENALDYETRAAISVAPKGYWLRR